MTQNFLNNIQSQQSHHIPHKKIPNFFNNQNIIQNISLLSSIKDNLITPLFLITESSYLALLTIKEQIIMIREDLDNNPF